MARGHPTKATGPAALGDARLFALAGLTLLVLLPFMDKAFHVDDPLFVWTARQIRDHPLDFYGFAVNWYGYEARIADVMKNPPGAGYLLALASVFFGWSEVALHAVSLLSALGVVWGTFLLARELRCDPALAALATLVNPIFLIASTQVMSDLPMLCLWNFALFAWVRGLGNGSARLVVLASVLAGLCALTKYFGVSLIPLMAAYGLLRRRRPGMWLAALLIPVALLAGYQWLTEEMYGRGLLLDAAAYADRTRLRFGRSLFERILTGLAFTGGCLSSLLFFLPRLVPRRLLVASAAVAGAGALFLPLVGSVGELTLRAEQGVAWGDAVQLVVFAALGVGWLALASLDAWQRRDPDSVLLLLWVAGTFVFAVFVNWGVNGRSLLPMAPAAGMLLARRLERSAPASTRALLVGGFLPALTLALLPTWADYRLANSARDAARRVMEQAGPEGGRVWFLGHWGFQYYMEQRGGRPVDRYAPDIAAGELLVSPANNTNVFDFPAEVLGDTATLSFETSGWIATMYPHHAGFYADVWGPLPYWFGRVPAEPYTLQRVVIDVRSRARPGSPNERPPR